MTKNSTGGIELQNADGTAIEPPLTELLFDVTYRINVLGDISLCASVMDKVECASKGPLFVTVEDGEKTTVTFSLEGESTSAFELDVSRRRSDGSSARAKNVGLMGIMVAVMMMAKLVLVA